MLGELQQIFWPCRNQLKLGFTCEFHSETNEYSTCCVNPCRGVFIPTSNLRVTQNLSPCLSPVRVWGARKQLLESQAWGLTCALKRYLGICMHGLHYFPNRRLNAPCPKTYSCCVPLQLEYTTRNT